MANKTPSQSPQHSRENYHYLSTVNGSNLTDRTAELKKGYTGVYERLMKKVGAGQQEVPDDLKSEWNAFNKELAGIEKSERVNMDEYNRIMAKAEKVIEQLEGKLTTAMLHNGKTLAERAADYYNKQLVHRKFSTGYVTRNGKKIERFIDVHESCTVRINGKEVKPHKEQHLGLNRYYFILGNTATVAIDVKIGADTHTMALNYDFDSVTPEVFAEDLAEKWDAQKEKDEAIQRDLNAGTQFKGVPRSPAPTPEPEVEEGSTTEEQEAALNALDEALEEAGMGGEPDVEDLNTIDLGDDTEPEVDPGMTVSTSTEPAEQQEPSTEAGQFIVDKGRSAINAATDALGTGLDAVASVLPDGAKKQPDSDDLVELPEIEEADLEFSGADDDISPEELMLTPEPVEEGLVEDDIVQEAAEGVQRDFDEMISGEPVVDESNLEEDAIPETPIPEPVPNDIERTETDPVAAEPSEFDEPLVPSETEVDTPVRNRAVPEERVQETPTPNAQFVRSKPTTEVPQASTEVPIPEPAPQPVEEPVQQAEVETSKPLESAETETKSKEGIDIENDVYSLTSLFDPEIRWEGKLAERIVKNSFNTSHAAEEYGLYLDGGQDLRQNKKFFVHGKVFPFNMQLANDRVVLSNFASALEKDPYDALVKVTKRQPDVPAAAAFVLRLKKLMDQYPTREEFMRPEVVLKAFEYTSSYSKDKTPDSVGLLIATLKHDSAKKKYGVYIDGDKNLREHDTFDKGRQWYESIRPHYDHVLVENFVYKLEKDPIGTVREFSLSNPDASDAARTMLAVAKRLEKMQRAESREDSTPRKSGEIASQEKDPDKKNS